jgi:hypothetical protein
MPPDLIVGITVNDLLLAKVERVTSEARRTIEETHRIREKAYAEIERLRQQQYELATQTLVTRQLLQENTALLSDSANFARSSRLT